MQVAVKPENIMRVVGGSATFKCEVDMSRVRILNPTIRKLGWYRQGRAPFPELRHAIYGLDNNTLLVWSLRFADMGAYFCEVEASSGDRGVANGYLTVGKEQRK